MNDPPPSVSAWLIREKIQKGELKAKKKEGQKKWEQFSEILNHDGSSDQYSHQQQLQGAVCVRQPQDRYLHHVCAKARGQPGEATTFVRRDSKRVPLEVKSKLVDDCMDLCCVDVRPFDMVTGKGFVQVARW